MIAREYVEAYCVNKDDLFHIFEERKVELAQLTFDVIELAIARYNFGTAEEGATENPYYIMLTAAKETARAELMDARNMESVLKQSVINKITNTVTIVTNSLHQAAKALPSPKPRKLAPTHSSDDLSAAAIIAARTPVAAVQPLLGSGLPVKPSLRKSLSLGDMLRESKESPNSVQPPALTAARGDIGIVSPVSSNSAPEKEKASDKDKGPRDVGYFAVSGTAGAVRRESGAVGRGRRESIGGPQRFVMPAPLTTHTKKASKTGNPYGNAVLPLDASPDSPESPSAASAPLVTSVVALRIPVTGTAKGVAAHGSGRPTAQRQSVAQHSALATISRSTSALVSPGPSTSAFSAQSLGSGDRSPRTLEIPLPSLRFFARFEYDFVDAFATHLVPNAFRAREIVFSEGDIVDTVVIVYRGQLEFLFHLMTVPIVGGDCCGDFEYFSHITRHFGTLVTREASELYSIELASLTALLEHYPDQAEVLRHSAEAQMAAWERSSHILMSHREKDIDGSATSRRTSSLEERLALAEARALEILSALEKLPLAQPPRPQVQRAGSLQPALPSVGEDNETEDNETGDG
jgi:CRP-like cAMP-binding protein